MIALEWCERNYEEEMNVLDWKKKNKLWRERKKNFFNEKKMNRSWMKRISSLYNDTKNLSDDLVCCVVWSSEIYVYDDDEQ